MSDRDRSELKEEINVVFHSAASIKFDDELSKAVLMNVRGTKELMDLAKGMGNLESFVHVSTCYSHCHLRDEVIQEKIYPPESLSVKEVLEMSRSEYRVGHLVVQLGFVDLDLGCYTILLGQ